MTAARVRGQRNGQGTGTTGDIMGTQQRKRNTRTGTGQQAGHGDTGYKLLVTIEEISRMTGIGINRMRAISKHHPTFPKPVDLGFESAENGRKRLYRPADIIAWIDSI